MEIRPVLLVLACATCTSGHGAMTQPPSRNAVDANVTPWNGTVPDEVPFMFWCASPDAASTDARKVSGAAGQACFFFNNGCDISCEECDGTSGQLVHPRFAHNSSRGPLSPWAGPYIPLPFTPPTFLRPERCKLMQIL